LTYTSNIHIQSLDNAFASSDVLLTHPLIPQYSNKGDTVMDVSTFQCKSNIKGEHQKSNLPVVE